MKFIDTSMIALGVGLVGSSFDIELAATIGIALIVLGIVNRFAK